MEPRVCVCGCGKKLLRRNGAPDYSRIFFDAECRNLDKARRMQAKRKKQPRGARPAAPTYRFYIRLRGRKLGLVNVETAVQLLRRHPEQLHRLLERLKVRACKEARRLVTPSGATLVLPLDPPRRASSAASAATGQERSSGSKTRRARSAAAGAGRA